MPEKISGKIKNFPEKIFQARKNEKKYQNFLEKLKKNAIKN